jgi:hypothetical protein
MTIIPRCGQIDLLSRELIEAYRRVDDVNLFCLPGDDDEVAALHHQITEHRNSCALCKRILSMSVSVKRKSAAVIDKTDIYPRASAHQIHRDG